MRRSRFLFLAVAVLYSFFTPGSRLWMDLPLPSPTLEGLVLAVEHASRLAGVLALVCMLVVAYPRDELVGGMVACLAPLHLLGLQIDLAALRMAIVLEMVSAPEGLPNWRTCFSSKAQEVPSTLAFVRVRVPDWRRADVLLILLLVSATEFTVRAFR